MDLNLLVALDVLLEEQSVARAARRMNLSAPAMSRTLTRIREAVGDPILVRAGRDLVPTARAEALRAEVHRLVAEARSLLAGSELELDSLQRTFVVRASDAVAGVFGAPLLAALRGGARGVTLRFAPEGEEDVAPLRDGRLDLDLGVASDLGPEIRVQALFEGRVLGVVRGGHPLASGPVTQRSYAEHAHLSYSRRGTARGPIDQALAAKGLTREVAAVVPSFFVMLQLVAASDLVGMIPSWLVGPATEALGVATFPLPVRTPPLSLVQAWHPRADADPAHRWLRDHVRAVCYEHTVRSSSLVR